MLYYSTNVSIDFWNKVMIESHFILLTPSLGWKYSLTRGERKWKTKVFKGGRSYFLNVKKKQKQMIFGMRILEQLQLLVIFFMKDN